MKTIQKKICLLGDFAVGKTSLVRRFVEGRFEDKYLSTLGVKISRKSLMYSEYRLDFIIWDIAGGASDTEYKLPITYMRGANGAIIVCDLVRDETIHRVPNYVAQLHQLDVTTPVILFGNKVDLVPNRLYYEQKLTEMAEAIKTAHLLTSAKTGESVEEGFSKLAEQIMYPVTPDAS